MMERAGKKCASSSFICAVVVKHLPNPTVLCRATRSAEEDMQAKATERSRFLKLGWRNSQKEHYDLLFLSSFVQVRWSLLPLSPTLLRPAGAQQTTCAVHISRCRRLRVIAFLGLSPPPPPRVGADADASRRKSWNRRRVRSGLSTRLDPCKALRRKAVSWISDANGARTSCTWPPTTKRFFFFLSPSEHAGVCTSKSVSQARTVLRGKRSCGALCGTVCISGQFVIASTRLWFVSTPPPIMSRASCIPPLSAVKSGGQTWFMLHELNGTNALTTQIGM